jgi:hypothetical protein
MVYCQALYCLITFPTFLPVGKNHQFPATPPHPHHPDGDWDSATSLTLCYTRTMTRQNQIDPPPPCLFTVKLTSPLCSGTCPLRYVLTPSYNFLCYSSGIGCSSRYAHSTERHCRIGGTPGRRQACEMQDQASGGGRPGATSLTGCL